MSEEAYTSIADEQVCASPVSRRLHLAELILSRMVTNILNEKTYTHYLRELVRLEKANDKKGDELEKFEIANLDTLHLQKSGKMTTSVRQSGRERVRDCSVF